ncbi:MAG: enoyl-CoA hydratase/isomerase family protein [Saccharofermentanales bacterium]|jgi:enoyl-CoA hydratase
MTFIKVEQKDFVALLTINRPEGLNALNTSVLQDLSEALDTLEKDRDVRVLIVTGAGDRAFVAGADIGEMAELTREEAVSFACAGHEVMNKLSSFPMPTIAAVNGYALGGGFELALACDLIVASSRARFAFPETSLGITPGFGGTQRLARLVGPMVACDLIFTGRRLNAEQALALGVVTEIAEPESLLERVLEIAHAIAEKAPVAIRNAKSAIYEGLCGTLSDGIAIEMEQFSRCFDTDDQKSAMRAFVNKEKAPPFQGR